MSSFSCILEDFYFSFDFDIVLALQSNIFKITIKFLLESETVVEISGLN